MLLGFMRNKAGAAEESPIREIEQMLEQTWDLAKKRMVKADSPDAAAVAVFNRLFVKLNQTMTAILKSIVTLASLSPLLFQFSKAFRQKAMAQEEKINDISKAGTRIADGIEEISSNTQVLSHDFAEIQKEVETALELGDQSMEGFSEIKKQMACLVETIQELQSNSASIGSIIDVINNISDETNILSLNARIETARGQSDGKGFKVIAEEVGHLAKQSKQATNAIHKQLTLLSDKIEETVDAVGRVDEQVIACEGWITDANGALGQACSQFTALSDNLCEINGATEGQSRDVSQVARDIIEIETSVKDQAKDVDTIFQIAQQVNSACDGMILDAGVFHLSSHGISRQKAEEIAGDPMIISGQRKTVEKSLLTHLEQNKFIELAYVTDQNGRQTTANIYSLSIENREGLEQGYGNDWSAKEWFTEPAKNGTAFVSKIYRSSATQCFCFTVSVPLIRQSLFAGVLGIDVNFTDMLNI